MAGETTLTRIVTSFLENKGWNYAAMSDGSLTLTFEGEHGTWHCRFFIDEARGVAAFYSLFPARVPAERDRAVVDFITRANLELILGNFEFDAQRGEIRYKTSIDVEGDRLTHALLTHVVHANVLSMDRYLPGLLQVIQDGAEASAATKEL